MMILAFHFHNQMISYLAKHVQPSLLQMLLAMSVARVESQNRIVDCPLGHEVSSANPDLAWSVLACLHQLDLLLLWKLD